MILPAAERKKISTPNEDYHSGLSTLWGEETLEKLRRFVRKGDIKERHIQAMADMMGVKRIFNSNTDKAGVDIRDTFESMLEEWYNQKPFNFNPHDAKIELMKVLSNGRCNIPNRFVSKIRDLCESYKQGPSTSN